MSTIDRREALRRTALIMGGALSAPTIAGILQGCKPDLKPNWIPTFFNEDQALTVMELTEAILPKTETPGAKELGVPKFIERMVSQVAKPKDKEAFVKGIDSFNQECMEKFDDKYVDLEAEQQATLLKEKNDQLSDAEYMKQFTDSRPFFWRIKELTIAGYFITEVGATQVLQYQQIPVEYKGCISLEEAGGKTWAT